MIIDFHTHVFPYAESNILGDLRKKSRFLFRPFTQLIHTIQPSLRLLPETLRAPIDQIGGAAVIPHLLIESSPKDLVENLIQNAVDHAVVIAHPPHCSNEFVIEHAKKNKKFITAVNIAQTEKNPAQKLDQYFAEGARVLKLHPAADGEGADSERYYALLRKAADLDLPVIVHTGAIANRLFYKDPKQGHAERFVEWFREFRKTPFILAHMNFHSPETALDIADENSNVFLDTSWQPTEMICRAAKRVGAERILFATDWPLGGNNIAVHLERIRAGVATGLLNETEADLILGKNAAKILKLGV